MSFKILTENSKGDERLKKLNKSGKVVFRTGVFGEDDSKMVIIGAVHEFGAEIKVTPKMRGYFLYKYGIPLKIGSTIKVPARKWLSLGFERNKKFYDKLFRKFFKDISISSFSYKSRCEAIALTISSKTKKELGKDMPPSLKYREGTPLVDSGDLRRSIGTKIVDKFGISETKGRGKDG